MDPLRHLDDRLRLDVNTLTRATGWLHPWVVGYAEYGPGAVRRIAARRRPHRPVRADTHLGCGRPLDRYRG